jgi:error-prone DNA polymerase
VKELMQALALIRPAPASAGMKEEFVRRARGIDAWVAPHPSLRGVLSDTYGIMLYEDDAMLVAAALGGIPLEEADLLRRAISKAKSKEKLADISRTFLGKAAANGVPPQVAQDLWVQMAKFNSYSFCKAHAASYAILAYHLAYLKAHYPLEFMAAVLNHQWGMYPKWVHLEEARRLGLNVLGPCVNHSDGQFTIESSPPLRGGIDFRPGGAGHVVRLSEADSSRPGGAGYIDGAIRIGLRQVKGLTERSIRRILAERGRRLFASLGDFLARVPVTDPEAENLILCGAFEFAGRSRPDLLLDLKTTDPAERRAGGRDGFGFGSWEPPKPPRLKDFSPEQKLVHELTILGLSPGKHPLAVLRELLCAADLVDSDALPRRIGQPVRIAGVVAALRTATTKNNGVMLFVSLEDEKGVFEVTLFPQVHKRFGHLIDGFGPYVVEGKVADQYGALTVEARKVTALAASQGWMGLGNDE